MENVEFYSNRKIIVEYHDNRVFKKKIIKKIKIHFLSSFKLLTKILRRKNWKVIFLNNWHAENTQAIKQTSNIRAKEEKKFIWNGKTKNKNVYISKSNDPINMNFTKSSSISLYSNFSLIQVLIFDIYAFFLLWLAMLKDFVCLLYLDVDLLLNIQWQSSTSKNAPLTITYYQWLRVLNFWIFAIV